MPEPTTRAYEELIGALHRAGYGFTTPTPATIERVNARPGNEVATDLAGAFGWSRPFQPGLLPREIRDLLVDGNLLVPAGDLVRSAVRVSSLGPDLFVHSAYPTTAPDSVFFGPDTYRFVGALRTRLETRRSAVRRAVDIGCGAGPGGLAVARACPAADVLMGDINSRALLLATANARAAGLANASAAPSDLLSGFDGTFDLVVSNPPYLNDPLARAYRHGGGELGAALSVRIVEAALPRLAPGGELVLYTGVAMVAGQDPFLRTVEPRLREAGVNWSYREIDPDVFGEELETDGYRGVDRIAAVVLVATKEG